MAYHWSAITQSLYGLKMKLNCLLLLFLSSNVLAQDFHTYELFNNNFQAVFPGQPIKLEAPDTIKLLKNTQSYVYVDEGSRIVFTAHYMPTNIKKENYKSSGMKQQLDDYIKNILTAADQKIINFSSTINNNKSTYIAIFTSRYTGEGKKNYTSTKRVYYKDKLYKWSVTSDDNSGKNIFDKYRKYNTIIK
ncbi:MAG: hypothetical protein ACI9L9_000389 [Marivirga sp.]